MNARQYDILKACIKINECAKGKPTRVARMFGVSVDEVKAVAGTNSYEQYLDYGDDEQFLESLFGGRRA